MVQVPYHTVKYKHQYHSTGIEEEAGKILRRRFYMELVLGFTQINYNFGHHFVSLELLTIHRNLINCHVKVVAHTLGRLYVLLLTLRPCFGVANANLVLLLHWEQIHVVFL